jgi:hypothetical protein
VADADAGQVRRIALALGLVLLPATALAQFSHLPQNVQSAIEERKKECEETATFKPKFVAEKDINGDGVKDYILDYGYFVCGESFVMFCGTGGCQTQVFASLDDGSYALVLDEQVRKLAFRKLKGRPAMVIDLHGSQCGRGGPDACGMTLYWNGQKFSPAN